jgi:hypothetical protein
MMTSEVRVSAGLTVQVGEYQYARITIEVESITPPDVRVGEAIDAVYDFVEDAVIDKLNQLIDRAEEEGYVR